MNLSKRLNVVASMVTKGNIVADVGTDHGYVPIYLIKNGICPVAFAMDINEGPLERAKEHIIMEGLEGKITLIRSDGMKGLAGEKVDSVVVAGMGGDLVCKILDESPVISEIKELILSPHSELSKVRKNIMEKGFVITSEKMVKDYGKFYNVIKAERKDKKEEYSEFEYEYGKILFETKDKVFYEYLLNLRDKYRSIIKQLNENEKGVSKRNYELRAKLDDCERAIAKF